MGLFKRSSRSSHDPIEREAILAYIHALTRLAARQEESGEKYNRVLVAVGGSIASSPTDAASAASAAEAMSDAAASIKADHSALSPVPSSAVATFFAWEAAWMEYEAWTAAQAAALRGIANGASPRADEVQRRFAQADVAHKKAERLEGQLMKTIRLTPAEAQRVMRSPKP